MTRSLRTFEMVRDEDVSGMSGVGVVGQVVEFADGTCVLRWLSEFKSTAIYDSLADLERIHGHEGRTRIVPTEQVADATRIVALESGLRWFLNLHGHGAGEGCEWCDRYRAVLDTQFAQEGGLHGDSR